MQIIYMIFSNQAKNARKKYQQVETVACEIKPEPFIRNHEILEPIIIHEANRRKSNQYQKIMRSLQYFFSAKKNQPQQSMQRSILAQ